MKSQFKILLFGLLICMASVSCQASPPSEDVGFHGPTIKQKATVEMPAIMVTAANDAYAFEVMTVQSFENYSVTYVKPEPVAQLVCLSSPLQKVDGLAVLSYNQVARDISHVKTRCKRIPNLGFHYIEGIATEYQC